jgi:predicted transcriptional regulator
MGKHHPNHNLVKIHRSYTVEEIAKMFGIYKGTVRNWIKDGLEAIDSKRPMLIHGQNLVTFIKNRKAKNKQPCKIGELYCFRCKVPKFPAGNVADCLPVTKKVGKLKALCPDCESIMNKNISLARIGEFCKKIDITFSKELQHIVDSAKPTENSDLR